MIGESEMKMYMIG